MKTSSNQSLEVNSDSKETEEFLKEYLSRRKDRSQKKPTLEELEVEDLTLINLPEPPRASSDLRASAPEFKPTSFAPVSPKSNQQEK